MEFIAGSVHTARAVMTNPTNAAWDYQGILFMGINQSSMALVNFHLNAGESKEVSFEIAMPTALGDYPVYIGVYVGSTFLEPLRQGEDVTIVATPSPTFAGSLAGAMIWYSPLPAWETVTINKEMPLDGEIHLAVAWRNESEVTIRGHVDLVVVHPDGTRATLSAVLNQDKEASFHSGYYVQFAPFLATQEGTYTLEATLTTGGQLLDSWTFTLVAAASNLPLAFTNFVATKITCPSATAWNAVRISCTITNPNSVAVSQDVSVMWSRYSRTYSQWVNCVGGWGGSTRHYCICDQMSNCLVNPFPVTLQPGQSMLFSYAGHCNPDPSDPGWNPCAPLLPMNYNWYFWLEDSLGNKSPESSFST